MLQLVPDELKGEIQLIFSNLETEEPEYFAVYDLETANEIAKDIIKTVKILKKK